MRMYIKSVFNLIEIFSQSNHQTNKQITNTQEHCESNSLHDYYCDPVKIQ